MLLKFINNSFKKYFNSDPEVASQLGQLKDQSILLVFTDLSKDFLITSKDSSIIVAKYQHDKGATELAATIHTSVATLLHLALGKDYMEMLSSGALTVDGDVESVNHLRAILMQIDIDWEEIVSRYAGDSFAYQSGVFARRTKSYLQRSAENFRLDMSEYLQEESEIVPTKTEINRFLRDVDTLDADIERLEARAHRLVKACS